MHRDLIRYICIETETQWSAIEQGGWSMECRSRGNRNAQIHHTSHIAYMHAMYECVYIDTARVIAVMGDEAELYDDPGFR